MFQTFIFTHFVRALSAAGAYFAVVTCSLWNLFGCGDLLSQARLGRILVRAEN